ncbi:hypothetical protein ABT369_52095 [Dactylosporangium sp. NPDC000244]|uniref:hypothetical protein n=1 Tax=Dactylosporangium sp. NPDC000244 TaxID=3154365 RepID=UPI003317B08F
MHKHGRSGKTIVVDGAQYHVAVRSNPQTIVLTAYPLGDKRSLFRMSLPWRGTGFEVISNIYRPALAERLIRRARELGWTTRLEIADGRRFIDEVLAADPLPALPPAPPSQDEDARMS